MLTLGAFLVPLSMDSTQAYGYTPTVDKSISLDGTDTLHTSAQVLASDTPSAVTIAGWAKNDRDDAYANDGGESDKEAIFSLGYYNSHRAELYLQAGALKFVPYGTTASVDVGFSPTKGVWHHYAMVYDESSGGDHYKIYVDGVEKASVATGDVDLNRAGSDRNDEVVYYGDKFEGSLDELKVYESALTEAEITTTKNNYGDATSSGALVSYYHFDDSVAEDEQSSGVLYLGADTGGDNPVTTGDVSYSQGAISDVPATTQDELILELDMSLHDGFADDEGFVELEFVGSSEDLAKLSIDWDDTDDGGNTFSHTYSETSGTKIIRVSSSDQDIRLTWGAGSQTNFAAPIYKNGTEYITDVLELPVWIDKYQASLAAAVNLASVPNSLPVETVGGVSRPVATDLELLFHGIPAPSQISNWDVSRVTTLRGTFAGRANNVDISAWDVSSVENMESTFQGNGSFDQPIGNWDVSSVTDTGSMFRDALDFNRDIGNWDVSSVVVMREMFEGAKVFNHDIGNWDVSSVTDMEQMFEDAEAFSQDIGNWDVSSVIDLSDMFQEAQSFNEPLDNWDVSSVTNMNDVFKDATSFNQDINSWDVSSVTTMAEMFYNATAFVQPLNNWDTGTVENFTSMFQSATSFNSYVGSWDTSSASFMSDMFTSSAYNICLPDSFFISGEGYSDVGLSGLDESSCVPYSGATAATYVPYYGPVVRPLLELDTLSGEEIVIPGYRMNTVETVMANDVEFEIVSQDLSAITIVVPQSVSGNVDLTLYWQNGTKSGSYRVQQALDVTPVETSGGNLEEKVVNAGSFKGYVAVYAKGYEGSRLSAKIGNDWVIVDPIVNNQENGTLHRTVDFTGADVDIQVRIFIDRVLMRTIPLTTK